MEFLSGIIKNNSFTDKRLNKFNDVKVYITIEKHYPKRGLQANKYFYKCIQLLGDYAGYSKEEIKAMFLIDINHCINVVELKTGCVNKIPKETHNLNTREFSEIIEKLIQWSAENFGYALQTPQEFFENN